MADDAHLGRDSLTRLLPVTPASGPLSGRSGHEPAGKTGRIGQKNDLKAVIKRS